MKYKVMIVEDQTMPRELFELRVQASERFELALSIDNAALADVYCLRFPVDLILMDVITRDGENGLDAAARIKRAFPQIKIIIVTSMPECSYLKRAKEIGVESFWYKEEQRESLLDVMERTMNGESVYPGASPELTLGMASSYQFTERELDILREITSGALRLPVVLMFLWKNLGFCLIIFLAALQSIPQPLYEYAQLEGAGFFTRAFRITLPMITPTAFLVFVLAWINAFKIFKEVYFIAGAYPDYSVYTLQNYMNNMFGKLNYQLVTAAAYSFGLIVFALFGALFFLQRRAARGLN